MLARLFDVSPKRMLNLPAVGRFLKHQKDVPQAADWSFLKGVPVYCICLQSSDDRYQHCLQEFTRVGLLPYVKFYRPERDTQGGVAGCWRSHDAVLRLILQTGAPYGLVFEDDSVFSKHWLKQLGQIRCFLQNESDWHFLRLGVQFLQSYNQKAVSCPDEINRAATLATHAYAVSREFIEAWVARARFIGRGVDEDYLAYTTKSYALNKPMVWQSSKFNTLHEWGEKGSQRYYVQKLVQNTLDYETWQKSLNIVMRLVHHLPIPFSVTNRTIRAIDIDVPKNPVAALLL